MTEKNEPMTKNKEHTARQDFFMETDKSHKVSYQKSGFQEPSVEVEKGKIEEKGGIAVTLPINIEDIPRTPLSERFSREEKR